MTLLGEIRAYVKRKGLLDSKFGRLALNDPAFVRDLSRGREPRSATVDRVRRYMVDNP